MPHVIDAEECVACGACASQCPVEAIAEGSDGKYHINPDVCTDCGSCVDICPVSAIAPK